MTPIDQLRQHILELQRTNYELTLENEQLYALIEESSEAGLKETIQGKTLELVYNEEVDE